MFSANIHKYLKYNNIVNNKNIMRKILFLLVMLIASIASYAQFKVSPNGIVSEDGKGFHVVEFEGVSASELYNRVEKYIISTYRNPDAVASKQPNEMINIHSYSKNAFPIRTILGMKHYADVDMNIIFRFKDGKIRIDSPSINKMPCHTLKDSDGVVFSGTKFFGDNTVYLYDKKGKEKNKKVIESLNLWLTLQITYIIESIKESKSVEDDW